MKFESCVSVPARIDNLKSEWKEMYLSLIVRLRCKVYTVTKHDV